MRQFRTSGSVGGRAVSARPTRRAAVSGEREESRRQLNGEMLRRTRTVEAPQHDERRPGCARQILRRESKVGLLRMTG